MKVAIIHDWLTTYAGAEKVLEEILKIYPEADVFSTVDHLEDKDRAFLQNKKVNTTFIQNLPFSKKKYRNYLPLMPFAIEQFDLSQYDLILSSSYAVAKGVITGPDQLHISYVHSPIRYAWDLQAQYLKESNLTKGPKSLLARYLLFNIRNWDYRTANGVDHFLSNSDFIGKRIEKVYRRQSTTIYPPVDVHRFQMKKEKDDFYVTASRMVPYKKIDLIVSAFSKMKDKKLIVIGDGPDFKKIHAKAGDNVQLLGYQPYEVLVDHMQRAKGFVFAAEEDFGITPVEAQACGTPVIAFGKGGSLETVKSIDTSTKPTGVFFERQDEDSIIKAVKRFEEHGHLINPVFCREHAMRFSPETFRSELKSFVTEKTNEFYRTQNMIRNAN
jgi:glycosyltransferase involved in cell wall biosynthesis